MIDGCRRAVVRRARRAHLGRGPTAAPGRRTTARGWPSCSRLRRAPAGAARGLGGAGDGTAGAPATCAGRPSCGGGCGTRIGAPDPAERLARGLRRAARRRRRWPACPSGCRCSAPTRLPADAPRRARRAGRAPRRAPVAAAPLPRAVGAGAAGAAGRPVRRARRPDGRAAAGHPLLASLGRDVARAAAAAGRRRAPTRHRTTTPARSAGHAARPAAGRPARRPAAGRRRSRSRRRTTAACRCTPATARHRQVEVLREVLARAAGRRPDAGAARHPGHVPGHRDVRAAGLGGVRARPSRAPTQPSRRTGCGCGWPTGRCARPTRCSDAVGRLLELADARVTAAAGARPAGLPPGAAAVRLRRRRRWSGCASWSPRSGVRWGLDAAHRAPLPARTGSGRTPGRPAWTGCCSASRWPRSDRGHWLGTALPLDDVDSRRRRRWSGGSPSSSTGSARRSTRCPASSRWPALGRRADRGPRRCSPRLPPRDAWQDGAGPAPSWPRRRGAAGPHAHDVPLGLPDVRALLADRLRGRPTRADFRTGTLTVCTMVPMRSVPHRVVCLLGLDDGVFPRAGVHGRRRRARPRPAGRRARPAQRGPPAAAGRGAAPPTERLVVLYTGADERTGARRPPAVPLGELLDVDRGRRPAAGRRGHVWCGTRCSRSTRATSPPARSAARRPFSFDRAALAGALAARRRPAPAPGAFLPGRCPPRADGRRRARRPGRRSSSTRCKAFLRQRLGSARPRRGRRADRRAAGRAGRPATLGGRRPAAARPAGRRRIADAVPRPSGGAASCRRARWATRLLTEVLDDVEPLVAATAPAARRPRRESLDVDVELPDGGRLVGTVGGVHGRRGRARSSTPGSRRSSGSGPGCAARADRRRARAALGRGHRRPRRAARAGRGRHGSDRSTPAAARDVLADLVGRCDRGLREPLPLPPRSPCTPTPARRLGGGGAGARRCDRGGDASWSRRRGPTSATTRHTPRVWGAGGRAARCSLATPAPAGERAAPGSAHLAHAGSWAPLLLAEEVAAA